MNLFEKPFLFSFLYDQKPFADCAPLVTQERCGDTLTRTYALPDGLKVTNILQYYPKHGAYQWVNRFENTGSRPTGLITELWDCDVTLPMVYQDPNPNRIYIQDPESTARLYIPNGSNWSKREFYCDDVDTARYNRRPNHLYYVGKPQHYSTTGGKSSSTTAPFFHVCQGGQGYVGAIGWSGQWNAVFTRETDGVQIRTKIEDTSFRLLPGESFRTSSMVLLPYTGTPEEGFVYWRRLVKEHFSLIGSPGRDTYGAFSAGHWGGMSTQSLMERLKFYSDNKLPHEEFWVDAGWYGRDTPISNSHMEQEWSLRNGDWAVSPLIHPNGMADLAEAVRKAGMQFLLWVEIERARKSAPTTWEHPEYFLDNGIEGDGNLLLNLGDEATYTYCFDTLADLISRLDVHYLRIDFNLDPLSFWRKADRADRKGITEIRYINNLYRLWDALLAEFPHLIIDNCSSGGQRIDIELNRRSIPLWRTDYACLLNCEPDGLQNHHIGFNRWLAYCGSGCRKNPTEYDVRSCYDGSMMTYETFLADKSYDNPETIAFWKKYGAEYLRVRPYFCEDFYPLTKISENSDVWIACQFDRPARADGLVQVFKRAESPFETAVFFLRGLDEQKNYRFTDLDGGEVVLSGAQLKREGFRVTITEKPKAKIWIYEAL